jgi:ketosteroid isomerase-like protein
VKPQALLSELCVRCKLSSSFDEFGEINRGLDEAYNRNDAAGVAAFFTEDALLVAPDGMFSGRPTVLLAAF